ncbi:MAG: hypothetical protein ACKO34_00905 [Vampirovibrionales bacterium]
MEFLKQLYPFQSNIQPSVKTAPTTASSEEAPSVATTSAPLATSSGFNPGQRFFADFQGLTATALTPRYQAGASVGFKGLDGQFNQGGSQFNFMA